jgi:hypothetical protein
MHALRAAVGVRWDLANHQLLEIFSPALKNGKEG